jgi:hypothetical protein
MKFRWASTLFCPLALAAALMAVARNGAGVDLGPWAREERRSQDWVSVDFREPYSGLFLAARAGTEDAKSRATLTLTAAPAYRCAPETVVVIQQDKPEPQDATQAATLVAQIDTQAPRRLRAQIVKERDDVFLFVEVLDRLSPDDLKHHQSLTITLPGKPSVRFSLRGFEPAWNQTLRSCRSFSAP